jgi:hypothetical protein
VQLARGNCLNIRDAANDFEEYAALILLRPNRQRRK